MLELTLDDVEWARVQERTIVKTWSMRAALHLHASNELFLYLGGLMPTRLVYHQRWIRGLGLKEEETTALVLKALEDGPLTRDQLAEFLAKRLAAKWEQWTDGGWGRKTEGSSLSWHLVRPAVVRGLVCFGPNAGQEITFARVDRWLHDSPSIHRPNPRRKTRLRPKSSIGLALAARTPVIFPRIRLRWLCVARETLTSI